tara:strand:- start:1962 stop:2780 length:819 start_codon:yes stop_codon:yes gene_type:complete
MSSVVDNWIESSDIVDICDYRIVIPTLDRPVEFRQKTLDMLYRHKIDMNKIDILLKTPQESKAYMDSIGDIWNGNFIYHYENELGDIVNFIKGYYKYETNVKYLLRLDDDIEEIYTGDKGKPIVNLHEFICDMFQYTLEKDLCFWGVSDTVNPFYLKKQITTNLKYCCGGFNGEIIDRNKHDIQIEHSQFEDVCVSCEHFLRDGGVVRNDWIGLKHKCWTKGGMASSVGSMEKRKALHERDALEIADKYGDMIKVKEYPWGKGLKINWRYKL